LTLHIVVQEFISLDQQVVLDRLILSKGVTAVTNHLRCVDTNRLQMVVRKPPKLCR
jgi:hypothetical protein